MNWLDTLLSLPTVCDFLESEEWSWGFSPQYLDRGRRLSAGGNVLEINHFVGSRSNFVGSAKVKGSRALPYKVGIVGKLEFGDWIFWGDCNCPVGTDCKHVAAFIYDLQKAIEDSRACGDQTTEYSQWLNQLKTALVPEPTPAKPTKPKRQTAGLAYLLRPRTDGLIEVGFGKLTYPANKPPSINNRDLSPNIRTSVPSYFQEGDEDLTIAFQQRLPKAPDNEYHWYDIRILNGPIASDLLPRLFASGRLFLSEEFQTAPKTEVPPPLTEGPAIVVNPQWDVDERGDCRPSLGLPSAKIQLVEISTAHYLDLENHQIGPINLAPGQSFALLKLWLDGPTVSAEIAGQLSVDMEGQEIPVAIPRPITLEEEILKHDGPTPVLILSRGQVLTHTLQETFGGRVRISAPPLASATLFFKYADQEISYAEEEITRVPHQGKLLVINRDLEEEAKAPQILSAFDFLPVVDLFNRDLIQSTALRNFGPDADLEDWNMKWAHFLAEVLPSLLEMGWEIREDPSFDLNVIEAADLFTDFTDDPDKGIDWFHFDTGLITTEGQRQSLMDLIASFLKTSDVIPEDHEISDDQRMLITDEIGKSFFNVPAKRFFRIVRSVRDLFSRPDDGLHRLEAAKLADELQLDDSKTLADLRALGEQLKKKEPHQPVPLPKKVKADLRDYQKDGFQWLQFLARHHLHGILADDMGLGKTLQTLTHIAVEIESKRHDGTPSLVVAPTSVVPNWEAEAQKFAPTLKILVLHGSDRHADFKKIQKSHLVITSYALLQRDQEKHISQPYHLAILDEAQYIKNPKAKVAIAACRLNAKHRICLSGTPMENHLGELWSLSRFLMPGLLGSQQDFTANFRTPIERHSNPDAQRLLNNKVGSLILRRTKDQVVQELPAKTEIVHRVALNKSQQDLYESVRVAMDKKVRDAIADKGLARSQIIVLDALLKLRQICCHPQLIKTEIAKKAKNSAKLDFLTELLATLIEEGRRILLFSQFTTMLGMIEDHLKKKKIKYTKITGATRNRKTPVEKFQAGEIPVFLISLKAGGTGLNLTAADTVIHYDPWWNPAAENQATDRAHRIGQKNPVFVHKLISEGTIEERILELQAKKSKLVEALLSEKTNKLQLDTETLENLFAPIEVEMEMSHEA